jgi:hypothetical protein
LVDDGSNRGKRHYQPQKHSVKDINLWELNHLLGVVDIIEAQHQCHTRNAITQTVMVLPNIKAFALIILPIWCYEHLPLGLVKRHFFADQF